MRFCTRAFASEVLYAQCGDGFWRGVVIGSCAQDPEKTIAGPAVLGEVWWRRREENVQFHLARQLSGHAPGPRADLLNPLQRVIVGTSRDGTRSFMQFENVLYNYPKEARPGAADGPQ